MKKVLANLDKCNITITLMDNCWSILTNYEADYKRYYPEELYIVGRRLILSIDDKLYNYE